MELNKRSEEFKALSDILERLIGAVESLHSHQRAKLLSKQELAKVINVGERTIEENSDDNDPDGLPRHHVNSRVLYDPNEVIEWVKSGRRPKKAKRLSETTPNLDELRRRIELNRSNSTTKGAGGLD